MDNDRGGRMLAMVLGGAAVLLGIIALVLDVVRDEDFSVGPLVAVAVGFVVLASARKRNGGP